MVDVGHIFSDLLQTNNQAIVGRIKAVGTHVGGSEKIGLNYDTFYTFWVSNHIPVS